MEGHMELIVQVLSFENSQEARASATVPGGMGSGDSLFYADIMQFLGARNFLPPRPSTFLAVSQSLPNYSTIADRYILALKDYSELLSDLEKAKYS